MGRGYNHYPNCGCGWCSSTWGNIRVDRSQLRRSMQIRDAERILRDGQASRGYSSCFVNPNATCPVCKGAVFYYQNDRGSRVFFDHLGPPWPKHGCTDNPRLSVSAISARPQPRMRGLRLELAEAATFLGIYDGGRYHQSGYPIDWQVIEILSVVRSGWELSLTGRLIEMADEPIVYFSITCSDDIIAVGDVVSGAYSIISAFHPGKLMPRSYRVTWFESEDFRTVVATGEHILRPLRNTPTVSLTNPEVDSVATTLIRRADLRRPRAKPATVARSKTKNAKVKAPKKRTSEPKQKSANQLKREEMLSKLVVEYRQDRISWSSKDEK